MPRLQYLDSVKPDFAAIALYIAVESGSAAVARQFIKSLRHKCQKLSTLPGTMGRDRSELQPGLRSIAHRGYIIYFRYTADRFQIVNILEGHRDAASHFGLDAADESETDD